MPPTAFSDLEPLLSVSESTMIERWLALKADAKEAQPITLSDGEIEWLRLEIDAAEVSKSTLKSPQKPDLAELDAVLREFVE